MHPIGLVLSGDVASMAVWHIALYRLAGSFHSGLRKYRPSDRGGQFSPVKILFSRDLIVHKAQRGFLPMVASWRRRNRFLMEFLGSLVTCFVLYLLHTVGVIPHAKLSKTFVVKKHTYSEGCYPPTVDPGGSRIFRCLHRRIENLLAYTMLSIMYSSRKKLL